jgi:zinc-binding alcohol dehydrogenase family protein
MKAVLCRRAPGADVVELENVIVPAPAEPKGHDMVVRIDGASLNPLDAKRAAARPVVDPEGAILGWSAVGTVEATGNAVRRFAVGDRVWYAGAPDRPGCFVERQLVDEHIVGRAPERLPIKRAAAIPLAGLTAAEIVFDHLKLSTQTTAQVVLVNGGGGLVASMVVQLARQVASATLIATAGSQQSAQWLRRIGAHHVIDHRDAIDAQLNSLPCAPPDAVVSIVTTPRAWSGYLAAIRPLGRICLVDHPAGIDLAQAREKSLTLHWQAMFTGPRYRTKDGARQGEHLSRIAAMFDRDELIPFPTHAALPLDAASIGPRLFQADGGARYVFAANQRISS